MAEVQKPYLAAFEQKYGSARRTADRTLSRHIFRNFLKNALRPRSSRNRPVSTSASSGRSDKVRSAWVASNYQTLQNQHDAVPIFGNRWRRSASQYHDQVRQSYVVRKAAAESTRAATAGSRDGSHSSGAVRTASRAVNFA